MIRERPGESNDREQVISSLDCDRFGRDLDKYRENFDKIDWGDKNKIVKFEGEHYKIDDVPCLEYILNSKS